MTIEKFLTFMSKDVKRNLIIHLFTCHEKECDVLDLVDLLKEKQANVSKHLGDLRRDKVVARTKQGKNSKYYVTNEFKKQYGYLVEEIMEHSDPALLNKMACKCFADGHVMEVGEHNHNLKYVSSVNKK
ncbi:transcriptional regulator [Mycoplasma sp. 888]|uniref:transcriptional regulator n=1 Tax=Mycoplasma sp. 888 TaxID=3108483 RepID=UPI002D79488A|nr:transcriptional regulator [Mycoplasma sp. 888]WRQ25524.1 transcriptional regulator [Mycoplasma sp. 888]